MLLVARPVLGLLSPGSPPKPRPCPWTRPRRNRGSRRRGSILGEGREELLLLEDEALGPIKIPGLACNPDFETCDRRLVA